MSKLASVVTRLEQSFGKLSAMSMESTQLVPILEPLSFSLRGLKFITTRLWGCPQKPSKREKSLSQEESLSQEQFWLTWNLAPWTVSDLVPMEESSDQTTLFRAKRCWQQLGQGALYR